VNRVSVLDRIVVRAALTPRRILFPDESVPAMRDALVRLVGENIVVPCFAGSCAGEFDGELAWGERAAGESVFHLIELATPTDAGETVLAFASGGPARLAAVARESAEQYRRLCDNEPRVALLSFSTHGSARHRAVDTVREAFETLREGHPTLAVGGELQGDAALVATIAASKAPGDPVAGRANVLVFPDGDSAEIGRALVERLGEARVAGPFTAGRARPLNLLSRGASADAIVLAAAVTALQAG